VWGFLFFGWGGWGQGLCRVVTDHSHSVVGPCILCGQLESCSVFVKMWARVFLPVFFLQIFSRSREFAKGRRECCQKSAGEDGGGGGGGNPVNTGGAYSGTFRYARDRFF